MMQAFFWMIYCSCYGYISYFLVEEGFGTSVVGVLSAVAGVLSAVGQPLVGAIADKPKIGWRKPLLSALVLLTVCGGALTFVSMRGAGAAICLFYSVIMLILGIALPLVNTAGVVFRDEINFGIGRGMGSFGYAVISYILGYLTAGYGPLVIPISIVAVSVLMLAVTLQMPAGPNSEDISTDEMDPDKGLDGSVSEAEAVSDEIRTSEKVTRTNVDESRTTGDVTETNAAGEEELYAKQGGFLQRYPQFTFLWGIFIFLLTVHCLSNSYLLQILEKAGGDSHNLGIAIFIAAMMEMPMIFFYEKINRYISTRTLLLIAAISYFLKSILQLWTSSLTVLYLVQLLQLTSWGIYATASVYFANEIIPERDRTKGQAFMSNALTIGTVIGSLIGGFLIERYQVNVMLVFQCTMALLGLVAMLIWRMKYRETR